MPEAALEVLEGEAAEAERPVEGVHELAEGRRAGQQCEGARLGAQAGALSRTPGRDRDERAHRDRDRQEEQEGGDIARPADAQRPERRREVPVDQEEAGDGGGERRPDAARGGDADDQQQEEHQDALQLHLVRDGREEPGQQGQPDRGEGEAEVQAPPRQRRKAPARRRLRGPLAGLVADDVHVEPRSGGVKGAGHGRAEEQPAEAAAVRRADDELRRVRRRGRLHERLAHVGARHLAVRPAELLHESPLPVQRPVRRDEAVLRCHVHGHEVGVHALCHACGPADQAVPFGRAVQRHQHAFARLPGVADAVAQPVLGEALLDPVGDPHEGELPECGEVPGTEVVAQRGVDPLRRVDVPPRQPGADRLRGMVDQLQLVCAPHHLVRHRLALDHARDALDDVVQRHEVLDVDGADDCDAGGEQLLDVLPALLVLGAGHIGVGEFVDEGEVGMPCQDGLHVHLLEGRVAVADHASRHDLQIADLVGGALAPVRLDEAGDDVLTPCLAAAALVEHRERLADARRGPEVHAQRASRGRRLHGRRLGLHDAAHILVLHTSRLLPEPVESHVRH